MAGLGFRGCWLWGMDSRFRGNDGAAGMMAVLGLAALGLTAGGGVFQRRGRGVRRGLCLAFVGLAAGRRGLMGDGGVFQR